MGSSQSTITAEGGCELQESSCWTNGIRRGAPRVGHPRACSRPSSQGHRDIPACGGFSSCQGKDHASWERHPRSMVNHDQEPCEAGRFGSSTISCDKVPGRTDDQPAEYPQVVWRLVFGQRSPRSGPSHRCGVNPLAEIAPCYGSAHPRVRVGDHPSTEAISGKSHRPRQRG